jgi:hypothetical protein
LSFDTGDRIASAIALSAGVDHGYFINHGRTLLFGGYKFSHFFADPTADNRDAHRLTIGLSHQFHPAFHGQLYYSYQYTEFLNFPRNDSRNVLGLNLVYQINQHVFTTLTGSLVDNESSRERARYHNALIGAAITLQY